MITLLWILFNHEIVQVSRHCYYLFCRSIFVLRYVLLVGTKAFQCSCLETIRLCILRFKLLSERKVIFFSPSTSQARDRRFDMQRISGHILYSFRTLQNIWFSRLLYSMDRVLNVFYFFTIPDIDSPIFYWELDIAGISGDVVNVVLRFGILQRQLFAWCPGVSYGRYRSLFFCEALFWGQRIFSLACRYFLFFSRPIKNFVGNLFFRDDCIHVI